MRFCIFILIFFSSANLFSQTVESMKKQSLIEGQEIIAVLNSSDFLSFNGEKSFFYYRNRETLEDNGVKKIKFNQLNDRIVSPKYVSLYYDFVIEGYEIGELSINFSVDDFKVEKSSFNPDLDVMNIRTEFLRKVLQGDFISISELKSIAKQNNFPTITSIKIENDNFWKQNQYTKKSKPVWILTFESGEKFFPFKREILKIHAVTGKVLSRYRV